MVTLVDDGEHFDEAPNDGIYGGVFQHTELPGGYRVTIAASLEDSYGQGVTSFTVREPSVDENFEVVSQKIAQLLEAYKHTLREDRNKASSTSLRITLDALLSMVIGKILAFVAKQMTKIPIVGPALRKAFEWVLERIKGLIEEILGHTIDRVSGLIYFTLVKKFGVEEAAGIYSSVQEILPNKLLNEKLESFLSNLLQKYVEEETGDILIDQIESSLNEWYSSNIAPHLFFLMDLELSLIHI